MLSNVNVDIFLISETHFTKEPHLKSIILTTVLEEVKYPTYDIQATTVRVITIKPTY